MKKFKRIINWTIWSLLALYLLIIALLQLPVVQGYLGGEISRALEDKLGTKVMVGKVAFGFPNRLIIDDVMLYDQKGKKMLGATRLSAKIDLYPLTKKKISVSSAQLFGLNGVFYQENDQTKPNYQFVLDSLASKDSTQHSPLDLRINSLVVRRGAIRYDRYDLPRSNGQFNLAHLSVSNFSTHIMLNELTDSTLSVTVKRLSFKEASGLRLNQLKLKLVADHQQAALRNLTVKLPNTHLQADSLCMTYRFDDGQLIKPSIRFKGCVNESYITPSDIKCFIPQLSSFESLIRLRTSFSGTSTTMNVSELEVSSQPEGLQLSANGSVSNFERPRWHVNVGNLNLSSKTIDFITRNLNIKNVHIPDAVTRLGDVRFRGEAGGAGESVSTKGILYTDAGNAKIGIGLRGSQLTGRLETDKLDLHRILANNDFGDISTRISIDGDLRALKGYPAKSLTMIGTITKFNYKKHVFNDLHIDGSYHDHTFDGALAINDPNGSINMKGLFKTTLQEPLYRLTAEIRDLNMGMLGMTGTWKDRRISADILADFGGSSINSANGIIDLQNLSVSSPQDHFMLQHLSLSADQNDGEQLVKVDSDFGNATIRGKFDYKTIVSSLQAQLTRRLPTIPGINNLKKGGNNDFTISATVNNTDWLHNLLGVPAIIHEPMYLYGRLNDLHNDLTIECSIPDITYDGSRYKDARLSLTSPNDSLVANISVNKKMDNGQLFSYDIQSNAFNNQLNTLIRFNNNQRHAFKGSIDTSTRFFDDANKKSAAHINVHPSEILVNDTVWHVQPSDIIYSDNHLIVDHFAVNHNKQHLLISGKATNNEKDTLFIDLQDVNVNYITNLVNFHSVEFDGLATGRAYIASAFKDLSASANLIVNHFTFEDGNMGTLHAGVNWNKREKQIDINAKAVDGLDKFTDIIGYVSPAKNFIDLGIYANNTRLEFLESFCGSFMRNVEARASGKLRLSGPLNNINLTGKAVTNGKLDISSLNTTYWLRNDTIRLIPNEIIFEHDTIYDRDNHTGIVTGALHHKSLTNLSYDIDITAKNLLAYDFDDYRDETFFGTVWATGSCAIHGKSGEIVMDIHAKPEKGSFIEYNASAPDAIANQEFIQWRDNTPGSPSSLSEPETDENAFDDNIASDMHLNFLIDCTPDATLRLLMDKHSGDMIALNGNGTIRATYYNKGAFDMFGTYLVDHGTYKLTIQNIIKKDFQFQQGSTIVFGGNPYDAILNLKALYTVNGVPLSDLNIGRSFSNNNIRVDCIMNITGNPNEPKVDFDLDLPTVNSDAKQMVRSIINGQEEMNQQVICLLGVGRFYTLENNNAEENAQQSQTSLAMQSLLSGTISQQINNVLSSVINNNNWNFGANISTGDEGWNNAEYEGLLSGRLLNNRLLINGQFGYRDNANATTSFIGDFDIRYLLLPSGNLSVKVYNQTNDRYFTKNSLNTQGVGLLMKKDFNDWRELFGWFRRRK